MNWITESLGYLAIAFGFYAATKKEMGDFRLWHLISSFFYIIYGFLLESGPLIIAGGIFCIIHVYHLNKIRKNQVYRNKN
mgnify:CR=1 FL=1